jgi:hypothetical protein
MKDKPPDLNNHLLEVMLWLAERGFLCREQTQTGKSGTDEKVEKVEVK